MIPLLIDNIMVCARDEHPLVHQATLTAETLEDYIMRTNNPVSFFHMLFLESDGMQYPKAISSSNSVELHKKLMSENNTLTIMPKMAYQSAFQNDGFAAVPLGQKDNTIHAVLYKEDASHENYELITRFAKAMKKQFEKRYGVFQKKQS